MRKPTKQDMLTADEHVELGKFLKCQRLYFVCFKVDLSQRYGKASHVARQMAAALSHIEDAQSELDGIMARECPSEYRASVYYGDLVNTDHESLERVHDGT